MKLRFIGTGGAFDVTYGNSAATLDAHGCRILIDCGHTVYPALRKLDIVPSITHILLTHLHDDHCGSLGTLVFDLHFLHHIRPVILVPDEGFRLQVRSYLSFYMGKPERFTDILLIEEAGIDWIHPVDTLGCHMAGMQTYSYVFTEDSEVIAYSGDLNAPDRLFDALSGIGHSTVTVFHEIDFHGSPAHTYYKNLEPWNERYMIYGYHCDPAFMPVDNRIQLVFQDPDLIWMDPVHLYPSLLQ